MDIAHILTKRYPGAQWTLNGDKYDGLTWLDEETPKPTLSDLEAEWDQVQYEFDYGQVETTRQTLYKSESDPIFFQWQRGEATQEEWLSAVQAIKDANPYPVDPSTIEPEPVVTIPDPADPPADPVEEV